MIRNEKDEHDPTPNAQPAKARTIRVCEECLGRTQVSCDQCEGSGEVVCDYCDATGASVSAEDDCAPPSGGLVFRCRECNTKVELSRDLEHGAWCPECRAQLQIPPTVFLPPHL